MRLKNSKIKSLIINSWFLFIFLMNYMTLCKDYSWYIPHVHLIHFTNLSVKNPSDRFRKEPKEPLCVFLGRECDWSTGFLISRCLNFQQLYLQRLIQCWRSGLTEEPLITGCRMKRMQQNSIMTNFQKPGFVFWICINGFWASFCFSFSETSGTFQDATKSPSPVRGSL